MTQWNPEVYLKYQDERTQPAYDLAARVEVVNPTSIVDIGCGPGNSTRVLRERWPSAAITGLDNSTEMLEAAEKTYPKERWIRADAATWDPAEKYDLVFSNAALQWIPDHESLLPRLFNFLNPMGGALAFQVPANTDSALHQAVIKVSKLGAWEARLRQARRILNYQNAAFYYDLLVNQAKRVVIWQTQYYHVMPGHQSLIDWYAGTGMRPYLEKLSGDDERQNFRRLVLEECSAQYSEQADGKILFPFNRLFVIAYR